MVVLSIILEEYLLRLQNDWQVTYFKVFDNANWQQEEYNLVEGRRPEATTRSAYC